MKKLRRFLMILFVLILTGAVFWAFGPTFAPEIRISEETTRLTDPLTEDGRVDYARAINDRNSVGVTPENNFNVALWEIVGPPPHGGGEYYDLIFDTMFKELQMERPDGEEDCLIGMNSFAEQEAARKGANHFVIEVQLERQKENAVQQPWSGDDYPLVLSWLEANEGPLEAIHEAAKLPRNFAPCIAPNGDLVQALLPATDACRHLTDLLFLRANYHIERGDIVAAWRDLLTCHRIAAQNGQGWCAVELAQATHLDGLACQRDHILIRHPKTTPEQLRLMLKQLGEVPSVKSTAEVLDAENYSLLSLVTLWSQRVAAGKPIDEDQRSSFEEKFSRRWMRRADWNEPLLLINQLFDEAKLAVNKPTYPEQDAALSEFYKNFRELSQEVRQSKRSLGYLVSPQPIGRAVAVIFCVNMFPSVRHMIHSETRGKLQRDMTRLAIALELHRREHDDAYPATLEELGDGYLPGDRPRDLFTAAPLKYVVEGEGYLLYSLGPNGTDETADLGPKSDELFVESDDLVIDFRGDTSQEFDAPGE